jgi:hypothetical protein
LKKTWYAWVTARVVAASELPEDRGEPPPVGALPVPVGVLPPLPELEQPVSASVTATPAYPTARIGWIMRTPLFALSKHFYREVGRVGSPGDRGGGK